MATRRGNTAVRQGRKVLNLTGYVTFYFTVLANKLSSGASRLYLKRYDIGIIEWRVMAMLAVEPRISPVRICQIIGLDKGAVSREMRKLEAKGYLTVDEDPESTRRRTLELTPSGQRGGILAIGNGIASLAGLSAPVVTGLLVQGAGAGHTATPTGRPASRKRSCSSPSCNSSETAPWARYPASEAGR